MASLRECCSYLSLNRCWLKCAYSAHSCLVFCSRAAGQGKFKQEFQQAFDLRLFFHDLLQ
jgi:hypothetical protein